MYFDQKHSLHLPSISSGAPAGPSLPSPSRIPTTSLTTSPSPPPPPFSVQQQQHQQQKEQYNAMPTLTSSWTQQQNTLPAVSPTSLVSPQQQQQQQQLSDKPLFEPPTSSPAPTFTYEQRPPQLQERHPHHHQQHYVIMQQYPSSRQPQTQPQRQPIFLYESNSTLNNRQYGSSNSLANYSTAASLTTTSLPEGSRYYDSNTHDSWWTVSELQLSSQQEQSQQKQQLPPLPYESNELQPTIPSPPDGQRYDAFSRTPLPNIPPPASSRSNQQPLPSYHHKQPQDGQRRQLQRFKHSPTPSLLSSSEEEFYHYGGHEVQLEFDSDLLMMQCDWTPEELQQRRRLVQFWREERDNKIVCGFQPVSQESHRGQVNRISAFCIVSCIFWESQRQCYMTSVDLVLLLEFLMNISLSMEEKNRVRRNLEGFKPVTASKNRDETVDFFRLIMNFPNPKPRHIEKDIKVFHWNTVPLALKKIVTKYRTSVLQKQKQQEQ